MARSERQKLKLLVLKDLLEQRTDAAHPISAQELIDALAEEGISAERKSIYSDISCLQEYGMDLLRSKGPGGGYYLASRNFELPELKLLVDAVQSSRFLTERKSRSLIDKISRLSSRMEAGSLKRQMVVSGRVKAMNESIYYSVDLLQEAIAQDRKIQFRYFDWALDGSRNYRPGTYEASPFALCWQDENYYLIAHSRHHGMTHYRVDKMAQITLLPEKRYMPEEAKHLDLAQYGKNVFGMFGGQKQTVRLRFDRSLVGVVIDRFGHEQMLIPDGPEHFTVTAQIAVSPNFFGWLAGFGNRAELLGPAEVRKNFAELLQNTKSLYEQQNQP